jgi:hypothetical protein
MAVAMHFVLIAMSLYVSFPANSAEAIYMAAKAGRKRESSIFCSLWSSLEVCFLQ